MSVLVTGGAGFIGGHVVRVLAERGWKPRVFDDLSSGRRANLPPGVEPVVGDVRDAAALLNAMAGCRWVIHLAARNSVSRSLLSPDSCFDVNALGTLRVLEAARQVGVERVVLASSSAAVRDAQTGRTVGTSPYAASKAAAEELARAWGISFGLPVRVLRFFNVYGPGQRGDLEWAAVVPRFVRAALLGVPAVIHGDGGQQRDFTWVGDTAHAAVLAVERHCDVGEAPIEIGGGNPASVVALHDLVSGCVGGEVRSPVFAPARPGDLRSSCAELGFAEASLGYRPTVPLAEGISRTVRWWRGELPRSADALGATAAPELELVG